jgi:hypothetical protein
MKREISFDTSLPQFIQSLLGYFDLADVETGWVMRDAVGRLAFVAATNIEHEKACKVGQALAELLSGYCLPDCILDTERPGIEYLIKNSRVFPAQVQIGKKKGASRLITVRVIDRRIVGSDWLRSPAPSWKVPGPAKLVFASLKGGVGRSTSLVVAAIELAARGKKVLAIDLDLEAPGLGTMLLRENDQPRFGVLDWFVERGISDSILGDRKFLTNMIGISPFAASNGLLHVVPAVGESSNGAPENILSKISRAYVETSGKDGEFNGLLQKTAELIDELVKSNPYDVILVDARAGLNESTAAALLGLGADVLLFGIDTPQTFATFRFLLAHMAKFTRDPSDDWLYRIKVVHAKASRDLAAQIAFRDRAYDVFEELLYKDEPLLGLDGEPIYDQVGIMVSPKKEFGLDEPEAPHFAWTVLADSNYAEFDPCSKESQLKHEFYGETYGGLLRGIEGLLELGEQA